MITESPTIDELVKNINLHMPPQRDGAVLILEDPQDKNKKKTFRAIQGQWVEEVQGETLKATVIEHSVYPRKIEAA